MKNTAINNSLVLLRTRQFGTFWFASLLSNIGTWAQQVAQPWLLLSLGASSVLLGLDSFAMNAPVWLLTLAGGVLADRADRRKVITGFQSAQMLCPILIVVLIVSHSIQPWMIIVLSLVVGVTDALSMPSFSSIVPSIVRRDQIGTGLALNSTQFNLSRIAGPALAGVLMSSVGTVGCFVVSAASYVPFIGVALLILPRRIASIRRVEAVNVHNSYSGFVDIARTPNLRDALISTFLTGLLCTPVVTFCPLLVKSAFHGSAQQFSLSIGAFGVGGLLGGISLLGVDSGYDRRRITSAFAVGLGLVLAAIALVPWIWSLIALLILAGACMSITNTSANTVVQSSASVQVRGETVSLYMLATRGGGALGSLITGVSAGLLDIRLALLVNATLAVLTQLLLRRHWRRTAIPIVPALSADK